MKRKIISIFGVACFVLTFTSLAAAQTTVVTYGPSTLRAENDSSDNLVFSDYLDIVALDVYSGGYCYRLGAMEFDRYLIPVNLPEGKIIKWIRLIYWDNDGVANHHLEVKLMRAQKWLPEGNPQIIYEVDSKGAAQDIVQSKVDLYPTVPNRAKVMNKACQYYLQVDFNTGSGSNLRFYAVDIAYN